jgi:hypothetical protein|tara:strand:+ start:1584 stop:2021 length:438 start_codon:yes stop_codon:yes gene_type:complete
MKKKSSDNTKILSLEEWKSLMALLNAEDEDRQIAYSNIRNWNLDIMYHMLLIKVLRYSHRRLFMDEFRIQSDSIKNIYRETDEFKFYDLQHGTGSWEKVLNVIKSLLKKRDKDFGDSILAIVEYEMGNIKPQRLEIENYFKNLRI